MSSSPFTDSGEWTERLRQQAVSCGFDLVRFAPSTPARHGEAFQSWIEKGYHADMHWITKGVERRLDPQGWFPEAKSMVLVGISYMTQKPPREIWEDPMRGKIARYAWGRDYHKVIRKRLLKLAEWIATEGPAGTKALPFIDANPVLEHDAALAAGMGFIGRNTLLIHPEWGSMLFLGGLLLTCECVADEATPGQGNLYESGNGKESDCGACTRCLTSCPTHAFPAAYILDSRLCISYQTIENRGGIPEALRPKMGNWIFGCDVCQEVCPWVKRSLRPARDPWLVPDPDRMAPRLEELAGLTDETFLKRFAGTPVMRTKRRGLLRNAAIALGNSRSQDAVPPLEHLADDQEELIAEHARWALKVLEGSAHI